MVQKAKTVFRDFVTDGVPSSGDNDPDKVEIRNWGTNVEQMILGAAAGATIYDSKSDMDADTSQAANVMAWVLGDATAANNGVYQFDGTSTWTRLGDLPYSYISASNAGAGMANAIVATTSIPVPEADGSALIALPIVADNTSATMTVAFNGGSALTIKTISGNSPAVGGLTAGMIVAGYVSGSNFRLLSDQASAAVLAACVAAQAAAEAAAASIDYLVVADRTALKAVDTAAHTVIYLKESGREGIFKWDNSDLSTAVTADTAEGIYVAPTSDTTGASGAWVRIFDGLFLVQRFGAKGDARRGLTGAITSGDKTFTDSAAAFTDADVGKTIHIGGAGTHGGDGALLMSTIASVTDATTVEIADAATNTVTDVQWVYGTDDTTAVKAAIKAAADASGGVVFFPAGGYLCTDYITPATIYHRVVLRGAAKRLSVIYHQRIDDANPLARPLIYALGSKGSNITVTAAVAQGDFTVPLDDTTGLAVGDYCYLQDPTNTIINGVLGTEACIVGEVVRIRSVDSSTQITVWSGIEEEYTTSAVLFKMNLCEGIGFEHLTIQNPIQGSVGLGGAGVIVNYTKDFFIDDVHWEGIDDAGLGGKYMVDTIINRPTFKDLSSDTTEFGGGGYGFSMTDGCWEMLIMGGMSEKLRHFFTSGTGPGRPEPAHITVADCKAHEAYGSGFDTHPGGGRHIVFDNCTVHGPIENPIEYGPGFQIRSRLTRIINPTVKNVGRGVYFVVGSDNDLEGGQFVDCATPISVLNSPRVRARGFRAIRPKTNVIEVSKSGTLAEMPGLEFRDFRVEGDPSGAALNFDYWEDNYEISNFDMPDVTTEASGVPHNAIHPGLHPSDYGAVKAENFHRALGVATAISPLASASGQLLLVAIELKKGLLVKKLIYAGGSAGTGQTNQWCALYDKDLKLLGVSNDFGTTTTIGLRATSLATATRLAYSGLYYVGIVCVATTPGNVRGAAGNSAMIGANPILCGLSTTGLTDPASAPATADALTTLGLLPWVAVA